MGTGGGGLTALTLAAREGDIESAKLLLDKGANVNQVTEYGWSANRDVRPEDITCSLYSALGIDYTTVLTDDPLGRGFEYVPFAKDGLYKPVGELF